MLAYELAVSPKDARSNGAVGARKGQHPLISESA